MPRGQLPLLIVEDDDVDCESLLRDLSDADLEVTIDIATNGADALFKLRCAQDSPVVLLDWFLPGMSGEEFLERLRADPEISCTEVFVLSGQDQLEQIQAAFAHQVAGYVIKDPSGRGFGRLMEMLTSYAASVGLR